MKIRLSSWMVAGALLAGAVTAEASPEPTPAVQLPVGAKLKPRSAAVLITRRPVGAPAAVAPESTPAPIAAPAPSPAPTATPAPALAPAETNQTHRVYGDVVISRPRWGEPAAPAQTSAGDSPLIVVPNNTLGPGPAYWEVRERDAADRRLAAAEALAAERDALAPLCDDPCGDAYYGGIYPRRGYVGRVRAPGFRPAFSASDVEFDDLGAAAQREFTRAATPRIGPAIDAQLQAQRDFNRSATQPVVEVQNRTDRAFLRGQKDLNSPRPAAPAPRRRGR